MKRTKALAEIKYAGYNNDLDKASQIQIANGIGSAAAKKAFMAGTRLKSLGVPCDCSACTAKKGSK